MSPETPRDPSYDIVDISVLIRGAVTRELQARNIGVPRPLERLLEYSEVLEAIMPAVTQRVVDQGHDFDSLDLIDALIGDEGDTGEPPKLEPDIDPDDDKGGGTRGPQEQTRPPDNSAGAEVILEQPIDDSESERIERYFPSLDPTDPLRQAPRVPVGHQGNHT